MRGLLLTLPFGVSLVSALTLKELNLDEEIRPHVVVRQAAAPSPNPCGPKVQGQQAGEPTNSCDGAAVPAAAVPGPAIYGTYLDSNVDAAVNAPQHTGQPDAISDWARACKTSIAYLCGSLNDQSVDKWTFHSEGISCSAHIYVPNPASGAAPIPSKEHCINDIFFPMLSALDANTGPAINRASVNLALYPIDDVGGMAVDSGYASCMIQFLGVSSNNVLPQYQKGASTKSAVRSTSKPASVLHSSSQTTQRPVIGTGTSSPVQSARNSTFVTKVSSSRPLAPVIPPPVSTTAQPVAPPPNSTTTTPAQPVVPPPGSTTTTPAAQPVVPPPGSTTTTPPVQPIVPNESGNSSTTCLPAIMGGTSHCGTFIWTHSTGTSVSQVQSSHPADIVAAGSGNTTTHPNAPVSNPPTTPHSSSPAIVQQPVTTVPPSNPPTNNTNPNPGGSSVPVQPPPSSKLPVVQQHSTTHLPPPPSSKPPVVQQHSTTHVQPPPSSNPPVVQQHSTTHIIIQQPASTNPPPIIPPSSASPQPPPSSQPASPSPSTNQGSGNCGGLYSQCGGKLYQGSTCCQAGLRCDFQSQWYSQCLNS